VDRAWDEKWEFNASYTLAWNKGNAEGPVNSDTDFADAGRTESGDVSGKWRFELPRYGKTIVVRQPRSGKTLHKITWTGEKFVKEK